MLNWTSEKPPAEISLQLILVLVLILPLPLPLPLPPTLLLPPAMELPLALRLADEEAGRKDSTHGRNGCAKSAADGAPAIPDKDEDNPPALPLAGENGDTDADKDDDNGDDADGEAAGRTRWVIAGTTSPSAPTAIYTSSPIDDWNTASVTNRTRNSSSCVCASTSWMRLRRKCQRRRIK